MTLSATPATILLIEDDIPFAATLQHWIARLWPNSQIRLCATLASTAQYLAKATPDFVVADLRLPDSTNPQATCASLVEMLPPLTPVMVVSGYCPKVEQITYLAMGVNACLSKSADIQFFPALLDLASTAWAQQRGIERRLSLSKQES